MSKSDKWMTVKLDGSKSTHTDIVQVNQYSAYLNKGDHFELTVNSKQTRKNGYIKWFHIPCKSKDKTTRIVLGIGIDEMSLQPITGNVYVKGSRAYEVKKCEKCDNGFGNGYFCEYWWKLTCIDISLTERGKKAIYEQIK